MNYSIIYSANSLTSKFQFVCNCTSVPDKRIKTTTVRYNTKRKTFRNSGSIVTCTHKYHRFVDKKYMRSFKTGHQATYVTKF